MKKTVSFIISAAISANIVLPAYAGYYEQRQLPDFNGSSMTYEPYDVSNIDSVISRLEALLDAPNKGDNVKTLFGTLYEEYQQLSYSYETAQILMDRNYNDSTLNDLTQATQISVEVGEKITKLIEKICKSQYRYIIDDIFGDEYTDDFLDNIPTEKFYELNLKEQEYIARYSEIYEDSDACAELFIELAQVRNDIAAECGYDNYADYAHTEIYNRDYSDEDISALTDAAVAYIYPLASKLLEISFDMHYDDEETTDEDMMRAVGGTMYDINDELGDTYRYMTEHDLYDIAYSDNKNYSAGNYTMMIDKVDVPYLFISDIWNGIYKTQNFIHETGHFCSLLHTPELDDEFAQFICSPSIDVSEIHSQGLELLMGKYYGRLFGSDAAAARTEKVFDILQSVMDGCAMDEWQTRVYKEKDLTVKKANEIMADILMRYYGYETEDLSEAQLDWTSIPHNFTAPMYYISYATSAVAALELLAMSEDDYEAAVDKYMKISAVGQYVPFCEMLSEIGMGDIFDKATVTNIADKINSAFGMGYDDVDYDAWYAGYIYNTAHIFDGRSKKGFAPDSRITRSEFVRLIGKMYDYYEGIDGSYTMTFTDVSADDESARYIMWAQAEGVIDGYSDTIFGGNDYITREQLVTIMHRLFEKQNGKVTGEDRYLRIYDDKDSISDWAYDSIAWAVSNGIIDGYDDYTLLPQGNTTRAEAAKITDEYIIAAY